ncbi:hypothetical protein HNV12_01265 [Methanococcoides sp. SA1]|nr:hypothetical protein [Methanococcoides sp. SA1]
MNDVKYREQSEISRLEGEMFLGLLKGIGNWGISEEVMSIYKRLEKPGNGFQHPSVLLGHLRDGQVGFWKEFLSRAFRDEFLLVRKERVELSELMSSLERAPEGVDVLGYQARLKFYRDSREYFSSGE